MKRDVSFIHLLWVNHANMWGATVLVMNIVTAYCPMDLTSHQIRSTIAQPQNEVVLAGRSRIGTNNIARDTSLLNMWGVTVLVLTVI